MMNEIKEFFSQELSTVDVTQIKQLTKILKLQLHSTADKDDMIRNIMDLISLDKDTALGTFILWLKASRDGHKRQKTEEHFNAFVPVLSPRKVKADQIRRDEEIDKLGKNEIHLDDDIVIALKDIEECEFKFKEKERQLHQGSPSYDKVKSFLIHLNMLRDQEIKCRLLLIDKNNLMIEKVKSIKTIESNTRQQLEFFIHGYTKLRKRHDELIEKSSTLAASDEVTHDIYFTIAGSETQFTEKMKKTLEHHTKIQQETLNELKECREKIINFQKEMEKMEKYKIEQEDKRCCLLKDIGCTKRQLRKCRIHLQNSLNQSKDSLHIRCELNTLRCQWLNTLNSHQKDIMNYAVTNNPDGLLRSKEVMNRIINNQLDHQKTSELYDLHQYTYMKWRPSNDLKQIIHGIVLVGNRLSGRRTQAFNIEKEYGYISMDVGKFIEKEKWKQLDDYSNQENDETIVDEKIGINKPEEDDCQVMDTFYTKALANTLLHDKNYVDNGWVLYNYHFKKKELDQLISYGCKIDMVLHLEIDQEELDLRQKRVLFKLNKSSSMLNNNRLDDNKIDAIQKLKDEYRHDTQIFNERIIEWKKSLGYRYDVVNAMEDINRVYGNIDRILKEKKKDYSKPFLKWGDSISCYNEANLMFIEDALSTLQQTILVNARRKGIPKLKQKTKSIVSNSSSKSNTKKSTSPPKELKTINKSNNSIKIKNIKKIKMR